MSAPQQVRVPGAILPVAEPPSTRRLPPRLLLLALLLLVPPLAMGMVQESRIAQLRLEVDAATMLGTQARNLGMHVDRLRTRTLEAVTARQQAPSLLLLLDRLSQTLPDGSYLTELRWEEGRLHLTGYSRDGAGLPALLDASPYLEDVRFEAALLRAGPQGDRFQLSLKAVANVTD
jgi:general secretion pathway protein L